MLPLEIPTTEFWNEETEEFFVIKGVTLNLEHSLISISKWESHYHKPFMSKEPKTIEETIYYIKCMTINNNVDQRVYSLITNDMINKVNAYIDDPMTATKIYDLKPNKGRRKRVITSELLYCWMVMANVPVEFEKWHLNRLVTLLEVIGIESDTDKKNKMTKRETMAYYAKENARRCAELGTKG